MQIYRPWAHVLAFVTYLTTPYIFQEIVDQKSATLKERKKRRILKWCERRFI